MPEKLKTIREAIDSGESFVRTVEVATREIDAEQRTVELAFASAEPVERWYGMEVFDMSPDAMRDERINKGGAFLMDHNWRDQVGVVVEGSAQIDADGIARCTVKMSRSARGEEIFQDIQDGIRQSISVGYSIHGYEVERGQADAPDTYRITDWEPLEISSVSVPADIVVGVGRDLKGGAAPAAAPEPTRDNSGEIPMSDVIENPETEERTAPEAAPESVADQGRNDDQENRSAIDAAIRTIGDDFGYRDLADDFIKLGRSKEEFQKAVAEKRANNYPINPGVDTRDIRIEMTMRARPKSLQIFRGNEENAYRAGMWVRATMFGDESARRWCNDSGVRVAVTTDFANAGVLVPEEMESSIIDLREQFGVARRLARMYPMGSDTLNIGRRVGGVTAYFVGEEDETTASDKSWDMVSLVARELSALSRISRSLAEDAVIDVAADLASEMAYAFVTKEDQCLIDGDGTSTYGGIQGLRHKIIQGTLAGAVDAAAGNDTIGEIDGDDLDNVRAALPEYAEMRGPNWLSSKAFKNKVFDAITRAAGGNTMESLGGAPRAAYLGDEIVTSQAMPKGLSTDYSNTAMAFYGAFDQGVAMGDRRGFAVQILNERYAEFRQIGVLAWERFDINVHSLGNDTDAGPIVGLIGE